MDKILSYFLHRRKLPICFLLTFLTTACIGLLIVSYLAQNRFKREQEQAFNVAQLMAGRIAHAVDNQLSLTYTLKALLEKSDGEAYAIEALLPDILGDLHAQSVSLAPDGIVKVIYPLEGNEKALNHDFLKDPARSADAKLAKDSKKLTLSGPYQLRQGGYGVIGRLPVYLSKENGSEFFWGFTCVVIGFPDGLTEARIDNLTLQGYAYELWTTKPESLEKQTIMTSELALSHPPVETSVFLPNSTWTLSIAPVNGWKNNNTFLFELLVVLLFASVCSFLSYTFLTLSDKKKELSQTLKQQSDNYRQLNKLNEDLRIFRHDMNNHMISLSSLLSQQEWDAASEYLQFITGSLSDSSRIVNTENYVLDALVSAKLKEARQKGIHVEQTIVIEKKLSIDNTDFSILFGNALDNAIEGCLNASVSSPELLLKIIYRGNMLLTVITNSFSGTSTSQGLSVSTSKADQINHGFGLKQIQSVAKKYKGTSEISYTEHYFTLSFTLFCV